MPKNIGTAVVDTTAFIQNAPLHEISTKIVTIQEVVDEVTEKRQLRRLVVLPYDLEIKPVFSEYVRIVTDFSKKTGDYPSLSATDIKVMALCYQLEKEQVGVEHLRTEPLVPRCIVTDQPGSDAAITGFYRPKNADEADEKAEGGVEEPIEEEVDEGVDEGMDKEVKEEVGEDVDELLVPVSDSDSDVSDDGNASDDGDDDGGGWITPGNLAKARRQLDEGLTEPRAVAVACVTADFAMQNVLRQMGLQVAAVDGRVIRQLRTFILRCHSCYRTTSRMEKVFCPKCGNKTLKKVAVSVDAQGVQRVHVNLRRPLTGRGTKFSLPTVHGGKHASFPQLCEDQPRPQQRLSRQALAKINPLDADYLASYSPFAIRDVSSKSAMLGLRPGANVKHWMKRNPNEPNRRRK